MLKAYEVVLRKHSIQAAEDTYYYRLLLKLSLDPNPDWWAKLAHERELAFRQVLSEVFTSVGCLKAASPSSAT